MQHDDALQQIRDLYDTLQKGMHQTWDRDLPFEELLFDRWARAKKLGFGENSSIYHNSYVYGKVTVGPNTWIGPYTLLDGTGTLDIGEWCCISANVHIYTHDTVSRFVSGGLEATHYLPVKIENNCYIGPHAIVRAGVTIGHHAVVGASSFVTKNVPPFTIVAGIPAKTIGLVCYDEAGKLVYLYD